MEYIKKFNEYLELLNEGITDIKNYKNWKIEYNQNLNHDLEIRLKERTNLKNVDDIDFIYKMIIDIVKDSGYYGECVFVFKQFDLKVISRIIPKEKKLKIITFLGIEYNTNKYNYIIEMPKIKI